MGTGGKRRKTLRSPKSAAPSINNLKRIALRDISLDVKIIIKKVETHLQQKQHKHRITEMNVKKCSIVQRSLKMGDTGTSETASYDSCKDTSTVSRVGQKKKIRYSQTFRNSWLQEERFKPWLRAPA